VTAAAPGSSWPALLASLLRGDDLTSADTAWAMGEVMAGEATAAQVAGFVVALRAKGETPAEVSGLVEVMLAEAAPVTVSGRVVDTCGTGGDRQNTVNISTMAALVVAGAGVPVVKHGNRAASSACGSADLLEALGVVVDLPPAAVGPCLEAAGIAFCFAPVFHPGMRHAAVPRRDLGVPTVFNVLGPLTNPARPAAQAVGVSDPRLAPVMAGVLADRGVDALVFRGDDGLDELTTTGPSTVWVPLRTTHTVDGVGGARRHGAGGGVRPGVARDRPRIPGRPARRGRGVQRLRRPRAAGRCARTGARRGAAERRGGTGCARGVRPAARRPAAVRVGAGRAGAGQRRGGHAARPLGRGQPLPAPLRPVELTAAPRDRAAPTSRTGPGPSGRCGSG
jgi:anthranilate phosphoribosyltransferase